MADTNTSGGDPRAAFRAQYGGGEPSARDSEYNDNVRADDDEETTEETDEAEGEDAAEAEEPETKADEGETEEAEEPEGEEKPESLISDKEYQQLEAKHKGDPAGLRKALESAFTKKTQALSKERKRIERLSSYETFIDRYEEDPEGTLRELLTRNGLKLADESEADEGETRRGTKAPTREARAEKLVSTLKTKFGPDLEYLAQPIGEALLETLDELTPEHLERVVKPTREQVSHLLSRVAEQESNTVMDVFGKKHPGWEQYESQMLRLAQQITPKNMTELQFMEHLYANVTRDDDVKREVAGRVKRQVDRMNTATSDTRHRSTDQSQVKRRPSGIPSFQDAARAAIRGERWED